MIGRLAAAGGVLAVVVVVGSAGQDPSGTAAAGALQAAAAAQEAKQQQTSTTPPAASGVTCSTAVASLKPDQKPVLNAAVAAAKAAGNDRQGAIVAVTAALQESMLRNLDHGHLDSIGPWQMRPSQGWGTAAQIMDLGYSSAKFQTVLSSVAGWRSMLIGDAAQAVERSGAPDAYTKHVALATMLVDATLGTCTTTPAPATGVVVPGAWKLSKPNPRTSEQAIAWAQAHATQGKPVAVGVCLSFVAQSYGWKYSGTVYAIDMFTTVIPAKDRHTDRNPPAGALVFFTTGKRAGHVALSTGGGGIISTDFPARNQVGATTIAGLEQKWGATYAGWTPPIFPNGGGTSGASWSR